MTPISSSGGLGDVRPHPPSMGIFPAVLPNLCSAILISLLLWKAAGREGIARKDHLHQKEGGNCITACFLWDKKLLRAAKTSRYHFHLTQEETDRKFLAPAFSAPYPQIPLLLFERHNQSSASAARESQSPISSSEDLDLSSILALQLTALNPTVLSSCFSSLHMREGENYLGLRTQRALCLAKYCPQRCDF